MAHEVYAAGSRDNVGPEQKFWAVVRRRRSESHAEGELIPWMTILYRGAAGPQWHDGDDDAVWHDDGQTAHTFVVGTHNSNSQYREFVLHESAVDDLRFVEDFRAYAARATSPGEAH